ncbi:TIGR01777 family oxidoreductase [Paeniglutamicibacter cryotolerans]|uniref:TIGR01777 family protein n=1 Tax=Paeniglutamicibacter cryotolerans TaxID=670079 RepID=A0A839QIZ3_9MICC|nr:TIGR01777 family oxidoreductase [Paeniglutamicibacter cryotolerans]MBB2995573.1 hypothetical protein [Paeniglutamicibacter cryotolerans]
MATFSYTTHLPFSREKVFAWFARPGALPRLSAPYLGTIRQEPDRGIDIGSRAVMDLAAPGTFGAGLQAAVGLGAKALHLSDRVRATVPWHALHTELEPGTHFADIMESGPLQSWRHSHDFKDILADGGPGTVMVDTVDYELPLLNKLPWGKPADWSEEVFGRTLSGIFEYREANLRADLEFHARYDGTAHTVAVAGASGLIGTQLCALLAGGGHRVIRLVRDPGAATDEDHVYWNPETGELDAAELREVDAVVNLAGHTIGGRFTAATKEKILDSRVTSTSLLARTLATLSSDGRERALICASAIGYYGAEPHGGAEAKPLQEGAPHGADFLASVCSAWEVACAPARDAGVRVVNVRTGIVQSPAGGVLQQLLPLYALGLGGPLGSKQHQSWIGIDDMAGIYAHAVLSPALTGPVNAVAPHPVTAAEYSATLGRVLRRPAVIPVPAFGPRLVLGLQGARELALADQLISCAKLEASGYVFRHSTLEPALRHVLGN